MSPALKSARARAHKARSAASSKYCERVQLLARST
jgi:hypothetical protein